MRKCPALALPRSKASSPHRLRSRHQLTHQLTHALCFTSSLPIDPSTLNPHESKPQALLQPTSSHMGLRMDDLHAPTVSSGPTSQATTNGTFKKQSLQELSAHKEKLEAELSALGSVLESVSLRAHNPRKYSITNDSALARCKHEHWPHNLRRLPARRHRRRADSHDKSKDCTTEE